jgi:hypothetical protein
MATDVKLDQRDGTFLELHGRIVKSVSSDFMLDSAERRKGGGPFRRALVHDQNDGLTINFAGDYPGGVTLNAVREISPHQIKKGPFQLEDPTPILVVRGGIEFEVHSTSITIGGDHGVKVTTLSLNGELTKLQNQISALQAKVAALEACLK